LKRGAATGAQLTGDVVGDLGPVIEQSLGDPDLEAHSREELTHFLDSGRRLKQWFLEHDHGTARPGVTPDMLQLKKGLDTYMPGALAILGAHDARHQPAAQG
jgi:hypothetical protein